MEQLLRYIFSITLLLMTHCALAQDTLIRVDTGPAIYVDYGKLLTIPTGFETKGEAGIIYQMKNRIAPNIQVGWGKLEPAAAIENGLYISEGWYARAGVNYLLPLDATNSFYAGVKYAISRYEEQIHYEIGSNLWSGLSESETRKELEADWFELIFGSEKKIKKSNWSMGGYFSVRILNNREKFAPIDTYAIPGYGRTFDKSTPAVNLYMKYNF